MLQLFQNCKVEKKMTWCIWSHFSVWSTSCFQFSNCCLSCNLRQSRRKEKCITSVYLTGKTIPQHNAATIPLSKGDSSLWSGSLTSTLSSNGSCNCGQVAHRSLSGLTFLKVAIVTFIQRTCILSWTQEPIFFLPKGNRSDLAANICKLVTHMNNLYLWLLLIVCILGSPDFYCENSCSVFCFFSPGTSKTIYNKISHFHSDTCSLLLPVNCALHTFSWSTFLLH